jgi:hypothetical protein
MRKAKEQRNESVSTQVDGHKIKSEEMDGLRKCHDFMAQRVIRLQIRVSEVATPVISSLDGIALFCAL